MVSATVWNEHRHEQQEGQAQEVYPDGIHATIADALSGYGHGVEAATIYAEASHVTERIQGWDSDGGVRIEGREWGDRSITVINEDGSETEPYTSPRDSAYENPQTKIDNFVDEISGETTPAATTADAVRAIAVSETAYESARTGGPVPVDLSTISNE